MSRWFTYVRDRRAFIDGRRIVLLFAVALRPFSQVAILKSQFTAGARGCSPVQSKCTTDIGVGYFDVRPRRVFRPHVAYFTGDTDNGSFHFTTIACSLVAAVLYQPTARVLDNVNLSPAAAINVDNQSRIFVVNFNPIPHVCRSANDWSTSRINIKLCINCKHIRIFPYDLSVHNVLQYVSIIPDMWFITGSSAGEIYYATLFKSNYHWSSFLVASCSSGS